jgi:predicted acyl esterase
MYDPANPAPTIGGNNLELKTCGPYDQRSVESRADVLTFTSAPLTTDMAVTGNIRALIYMGSNCRYVKKHRPLAANIYRHRWLPLSKHLTLRCR